MAAEQSLGGASLHTAGQIEGLAGLIEPGSLLEATPECLVITATDGRIVFANRRVQELTGFARDDLIDRHVDFLLDNGLSDVTETTFEARCRRADAEPIAVEVHLGHIEGPRAVAGRHAARHDRAEGGLARPASRPRRSTARWSTRSRPSSTWTRSTRTPTAST